ncbi:MAG: MFS transporter [Spirochaetaceae bacterium]|jgi:hypothetical protein|nr:MFS transporter [Spirochaetaceae bacterium]
MAALSPYKLAKARDTYNIFNLMSSASQQFVVGTIVILFAMRLNANSTTIGILNALGYLSFFFMLLGKIIILKFPIIKMYGISWFVRALGMAPPIIIPLLVAGGHMDSSMLILLAGVFAFHMFRGIGMIANNPILDTLAQGPDRGIYLTQVQIVTSATGMFCNFAVALVLGRSPPLWLYSVLIVIGVVAGVISGVLVLKLPDPNTDVPAEGGEKQKSEGFFKVFKQGMAMKEIRSFILVLVLVALISGIARAFVTVYSREVFEQGDGMVSLYAVFGGLGNLAIGLCIKFLIDRIGVKPIYLTCTIIGILGMIPVVLFPASGIDNEVTVILFLSAVFFLLNFGFLGAEGIAQTYFLALVPRKMMLDMGIIYWLVFGFAGASGNLLAGVLLDTFRAFEISNFASYKLLYSLLIILGIVVIILMRKLAPLGSLPFRGAMGVIFSPRDLRAISLLDRLNKSGDSDEEEELLEQLHETPSKLAVKGLLSKVLSPRLSNRQEALRAIDALSELDDTAVKALMDDIVNNPYTTAYISARILGRHKCAEAIPLLRELAMSSSGDYMLIGEALIALARLNDDPFLPQVEKIVEKTKNPRLKIMGVEACGVYRSPKALGALIDVLITKDPPPYLCDEVVLSMAAIIDHEGGSTAGKLFYNLLVRLNRDENSFAALASDEAESAVEYFAETLGGWAHLARRVTKVQKKNKGVESPIALATRLAKELQEAVRAYAEENNGAKLSRWILSLTNFENIVDLYIAAFLAELVLDDALAESKQIKVLVVHWAARIIRLWAKRLKI